MGIFGPSSNADGLKSEAEKLQRDKQYQADHETRVRRQLESTITDLEREKASLESQKTRLVSDHESAMADLDDQIKSAEEQLAEAQAGMEALG
jgi:chromosome segregation ATPase